jgi:formylglycine-generating enzyme required for sulfatase activity
MLRNIHHICFAGGLLWALALCGAEPVAPGMVRIPDGIYLPFFRSANDAKEIRVKAFALDILPVTNGEFLEFVRTHPQWRRSQVKHLFADESYLKNWAGDLELGSNAPADAPATFISWFAARAYAESKGKRLPTVAEWEYAASASPARPEGENDPEFKRQVLAWYSTPASENKLRVGTSRPNYWGVCDLHGLVWEWVRDFNIALVADDSRGESGLDRQLFCGAGSQGAADVDNFPAFMRYGFRSSLKADYCVHNLGFRCAKDL